MISRDAEGDLFVKLRARQVAESRAMMLPAEKVPGLQLLRRAFHQRSYEINLLTGGKHQPAAMTSEVDRLRDHVSDAQTPVGAYLHYLANLYLDFPEPARELMLAYREDHMWDRLEQRPLLSKILYLLIAVAIAGITLRLLGFPVAVP